MIPLHQIQIPVPCHEDWNAMNGSNEGRFCAKCQKTVYDLSQMTEADAQDLLDRTGMRVCVRLTRLADGAVLTRDTVLTNSTFQQTQRRLRKTPHSAARAKPRTFKHPKMLVGHIISAKPVQAAPPLMGAPPPPALPPAQPTDGSK